MSKPDRHWLAVSEIKGEGVIKLGVSSSIGEETLSADTRAVMLDVVRELSPSAVSELRPDTELIAELGYDSLGMVELLVALEDALDLPPLDTEVLGDTEKVADIERIVSEANARKTQRQERD